MSDLEVVGTEPHQLWTQTDSTFSFLQAFETFTARTASLKLVILGLQGIQNVLLQLSTEANMKSGGVIFSSQLNQIHSDKQCFTEVSCLICV
jgi:hypothetical protein